MIFPFDFDGIVGGYKLRRMYLHCLWSPYDFFRQQTRTNCVSKSCYHKSCHKEVSVFSWTCSHGMEQRDTFVYILMSIFKFCSFVVCYFMSILVLQSSWWGRESWLLCLVVFLVSRDGGAALPRGATGLSAVCDCGISWSHSLNIFHKV